MAENRNKRLILHVGMPKTGTTALQFWCHDNRGALAKNGVYYPNPSEEEFSPKHQFVVDELRKGVFDRVESALKESEHSTLIFSSEGLSNHLDQFSDEALARFKEVVSDYHVEIVLVLREPERWINSMWKEGILAAPGYAYPMEVYAQEPKILQLADYETLRENLKNKFQADSVSVIQLEDGWKSAFLSILGLQEFEEETEPRQQNVSLSDDVIEIMRQINALRLGPNLRLLMLSVVQSEIRSKHNRMAELMNLPKPGIMQALELRNIFASLTAHNDNQKELLVALNKRSDDLHKQAQLRAIEKSSISVQRALDLVGINGVRGQFPKSGDSRFHSKLLFPDFLPKFQINFDDGKPAYFVGCGFVRALERAFSSYDISVPMHNFSVPRKEYPFSDKGILNDLNPGTVSQKVLNALRGIAEWPPETLMRSNDGVIDLLLPPEACAPVTQERATERRQEISDLYSKIPNASAIFLSLAHTEAWLDKETGLYLNSIPMDFFNGENSDRYALQELDVFHILPMMEKLIERFKGKNKKIVLMVSPLPVAQTYSNRDAIMSDALTKSILRVCVERLSKKYDHVDYFPAYEIVNSGGFSAFNAENTKVKPKVVKEIAAQILKCYGKSTITPQF